MWKTSLKDNNVLYCKISHGFISFIAYSHQTFQILWWRKSSFSLAVESKRELSLKNVSHLKEHSLNISQVSPKTHMKWQRLHYIICMKVQSLPLFYYVNEWIVQWTSFHLPVSFRWQIPEEPWKAMKWMQAVSAVNPKNFSMTVNSCICNEHFRPDDYTQLVSNATLKTTAIPSIFSNSDHRKVGYNVIISLQISLFLICESSFSGVVQKRVHSRCNGMMTSTQILPWLAEIMQTA